MSRRLCAVRLTNATYLDLWPETAAHPLINHFSHCFKIKMQLLKKNEQNLPAEEDSHDAQRVNPPMHRLKFSHRKIFSPSIRTNKSLAWKKTADKRHQKVNSTGNLCYCWPILFTSCMSITPFTAKSKAMLPSISMDNQSRKQGGKTRDHKKISSSIAIEANHLCRIQHECVLSVHSGEPLRNRTSADSMPCG